MLHSNDEKIPQMLVLQANITVTNNYETQTVKDNVTNAKSYYSTPYDLNDQIDDLQNEQGDII